MQMILLQDQAALDRIERIDQKMRANLHEQRLQLHDPLLLLLLFDVVNQSLKLIEHRIQRAAQLGDVVPSLHFQPGVQISHAELPDDALQLLDRPVQPFGDKHRRNRKNDEKQNDAPDPRVKGPRNFPGKRLFAGLINQGPIRFVERHFRAQVGRGGCRIGRGKLRASGNAVLFCIKQGHLAELGKA